MPNTQGCSWQDGFFVSLNGLRNFWQTTPASAHQLPMGVVCFHCEYFRIRWFTEAWMLASESSLSGTSIGDPAMGVLANKGGVTLFRC